MGLLKEIPFLRFLTFLLLGIVCSYHSPIKFEIVFISLAVLSFITFLIFHLSPKLYRSYQKRWMAGFFVFVFLFLIGWLVTQLKLPTTLEADYPLMARGKIITFEQRKAGLHRIIFEPNVVTNDSLPIKHGDSWLLMVNGNLTDKKLATGMIIAVQGTLQKHQKSSNPESFDYGLFLYRNGIVGQMFLDSTQLQVQSEKPEWSLQVFSSRCREYCTRIFAECGVNGSRLGVLNALVLGERKGIDRELNQNFIRSGAIHLLAVSGLHVGVVFLFLNYLFSFFFKQSHPVRVILTILLLFFYAFITGFSPSVTRAVVMFSFIQSGKAFARHINMYNILCLSAFIILLWNPLFIFHVGFWLSHLAVAGIVAFYPLINSIFSFKFILWRWIWSIISVSVAAQITTVPFSLWMFGTFPTYFLLTNIILIPVVGPVLIISFIILMVSWIPVVPIVLGAFLNDLVGFMEGVVNYIESLPNSYITNIWVSWPLTMTMFLLIFFWYQNYQNPKPRLMLKTAFLLSLVMIIINIQWFIKSSSNKFIVFDAGQQFFVEVVNNGRSVAFSSTGIEDFQQIFISGGFEKRYVNRINDLYFLNDVSGNQPPETYRISCGNKTYCLLIGGKGSLVADLTHKVDVLVISGKPNINLSELVKWLKCDTIVFASNCPPWKVGKWRNQLAHLNVFIHDVRSMGAYIDSY